jgi:hypothetical protein
VSGDIILSFFSGGIMLPVVSGDILLSFVDDIPLKTGRMMPH